MSQLPKNRTENVFDDFKKAYSPTQALVEANRCLYCFDAPCITACPTSIDIPKFIRRIANENVKGAANAIFDSNILGMFETFQMFTKCRPFHFSCRNA